MSNKKVPLKYFLKNIEPFSYLSSYVNKVAAYLLYKFQKLPLSPNRITIASFLLIVLSPVFLIVFRSKTMFIVLLYLSFSLDTADGIWARTMKQTSKGGAFLDQYSDYTKNYIVDITIVFNYYVNEYSLAGNRYLLIGLIFYLSVKSLYYLASVSFLKDVRQLYTKKVKAFTYTPAEKYLLAWPLTVLLEPIFIIYYSLTFVLHFSATVIMVSSKIMGKNNLFGRD